MNERGTIGSILMNLGRITEDDVSRALAYQRENGGYFGEALVACGLASEGEVEWGLASQFDVPYVFPDAESVDYEAIALVSPEWALAHLALPIMKTADSLTVVVDSPLKTKVIADLSSRTGLRIEVALAPASRIRELIREVYARAAAADDPGYRAPLELPDAWDEVLHAAAPRFGISARGGRATVWWDDAGTVRRRRLSGDWEGALEHSLDPGPTSALGEASRATWDARLTRAGTITPVDVRYLSDESGVEYLFHPLEVVPQLEERFPLPNPGVLSEVRLLARTGRARFVVTSVPAELGHRILPHLPELLLDPNWRSIYISASDRPEAEAAFSHRLSDEPEAWATELETLRAFRFDTVAVDLWSGAPDWPASALDVASVAFLLWRADDDMGPAYEAGVRWHLHIQEQDGGGLEWSLEALQT
jgi:type IV pilus assembly protein PilB